MPSENNMNDYDNTINYLYSLQNFGIKLGLTNITALLRRLGSPHEAYKTIHIAGTNGKGSTASALESVLLKEGYRVGLYTSPHLVDFKERFRVNGKDIDEQSIVRLTKIIRARKDDLNIDSEITFFEYTTALAFCYFMEQDVDIAIIEVGMGGRLDATNVLTPTVSVITSISKEHEQYLGDTLEEIAGEKAGIIKEDIPVVLSANDDRVVKVVEQIAKKKRAKLHRQNQGFEYIVRRDGTFDYHGINKAYAYLEKGLLGAHQYSNFTTALAALEVISDKGFSVSEESVRTGLKTARWPGRFEVVSDTPLIILDGAHNNESMETAVKTLSEHYADKRVITVLGVMKDKDVSGIIERVERVSDNVIITKPEIDRAASPDELAGLFSGDKEVVTTVSVDEALNRAKEMTDTDSLIFVTGSLFTVGDAKRHLDARHLNT